VKQYLIKATVLRAGAEHMAARSDAGELWLWGGRFGAPSVVALPGGARAWKLLACGAECVVATTVDGMHIYVYMYVCIDK